MIPIVFSDDSETAGYKRLAEALRDAIQLSKLKPGEVMPSTREMAASVGMSRGTVVRAYELLVSDGYLVARPGGKTHVATHAKQQPAFGQELDTAVGADAISDKLNTFARRLNLLYSPGSSAGTMESLNYGAPPKWTLPLSKWKFYLSKTCANIDLELIEYAPPVFGDLGAREVLAEYLYRRKGIHCQAAQTIVFADANSSLSYIARLLLESGDIVIVEDPIHAKGRAVFKAHGAEVISIPVDEDGIRTDLLEEQLNRCSVKLVYVTPAFQDPTGINMSISRRRHLLQLAETHQFLIVEDGWDSELSYINPNPPSLFSLSKQNNVFYIYSFWKILYPLSMTGCLIVPPQFIPIFESAKKHSNGETPVIEHQTLAEFISSGTLEKHLKVTRRQLILRRQKLMSTLLAVFGTEVQIAKQSSAYWLLVRFNRNLERSYIEKIAQKKGINLVATNLFYASPEKIFNEYLVPFAAY